MPDAPTVYKIPEENLEGFMAKIAKLSKRSMKLIGKPVVATIVGETRTTRTHNGKHVEQVHYQVTLEAETPRIAGWSFVATIDHSPAAGNIVRVVPNTVAELPERYRTVAPFCEHCQSRRRRHDTFVMRCDADGELKQIGRNCLRDFLGHDPAQVALLAQSLAEASEAGDDPDMPPADRRYIPVASYLCHVAAMIRLHGWVSAKQSREAPEDAPLRSTASRAMDNLFPPRGRDGRRLREDITDADRKIAEAALAWAATLSAKRDLSDYEHNLAMLAQERHIEHRSTGLVASTIVAYLRAQEREINRAQRRAALHLDHSQHIGTEGERLRGIAATVIGIRAFESRFGATHLYRFQAAGNVLCWFATSPQELRIGDAVSVTGTVKKHDDYEGTKQTVLTRCTVTAATPTGATA